MAIIDLPDGRTLHIEISGPAAGQVLLLHHGTPGSLIAPGGLRRAAHARGLRLLTYSRAGYGASSRNPGRSVADVVPDVEAALDRVGAGRCLVIGKSGGGPHALATAAALPDRVAGVASIAGVGPWGEPDLDFLAGMGEQNLDEFAAARQGEVALREWIERDAGEMRGVDAPALIAAMSTLLPAADRAVLTDEYGEDVVASINEGLRTGVDGWLDDDLAAIKPWGFDLGHITVPTFIWQGSADLMVPFAHGQWLVEHIPGAVARLEPGQGHFSITVGAVDRMLDELVATM